VDIMLKHIAAAGTPFAASLQVSFALAFIGMSFWLAVRAGRGQGAWRWRNFLQCPKCGETAPSKAYFASK
jgi:hypothetical protein